MEGLVSHIRAVTESQTVKLNVGGTMYTVPLPLLNKYPDSNLCHWVNGPDRRMDESGNYYIDGDGTLFRYIALKVS